MPEIQNTSAPSGGDGRSPQRMQGTAIYSTLSTRARWRTARRRERVLDGSWIVVLHPRYCANPHRQ